MTTTTHHNTTRHDTQVNMYTLGHHLRIAQEQYLNHAQVMDEAGENFHPVRDTFRRMAEECETLANALQHEDMKRIKVMGGSVLFTWEDWND